MKKDFAQILKDWRRRRRLSQPDAAAELGVPVASLRNWEQRRSSPFGQTLMKLLPKLTQDERL